MNIEQIPIQFITNELKSVFSVPRKQRKVGSNGRVDIEMSSPIQPFDVVSLIKDRISFDEELIDLTEEKRLHIVESYLKLTNSVKFLLVSADETYRDQKTFQWKLVAYD